MNAQLIKPSTLSRSRSHQTMAVLPNDEKLAYTVSLLNRGNPDFGQAATQPLPSSRCYKKSVSSLLEARRVCLEYIRKYRLGGSNWCGGQVTNAQGRKIAHISYNGRIWEASDKTLGLKNPYPPILIYNRKQGHLIICYSHIYKELTVRPKELTGEFRFMDPFNDNQGLLVVLKPALVESTITVQIFPTLYEGRQGWLATTSEPLAESQVEFI